MKKAMTFGMVAVLVMLPILGLAATSAEMAAKAAADAAACVAKANDALTQAQDKATKAAEAVKAAEAALAQATAKGDQKLIDAAKLALRQATNKQRYADTTLATTKDLVEKLKIAADKAKAAAQLAATAKSPEEATRAAHTAQSEALKASLILRRIEGLLQAKMPPFFMMSTTTTTTTSTTTTTTTQPSPTPAGQR